MSQPLDEYDRTPSGSAFTALLLEVFRLNGRLVAEGDKLAAPFGLTSARWQVLGALSDGALPVTGISGRMGLRRQSVQRLVDELVEDGMLELGENPRHRRAKLIRRTRRGSSAFRQVLKHQASWANALADGVEPAILADALGVLRELRERIEEKEAQDQGRAQSSTSKRRKTASGTR